MSCVAVCNFRADAGTGNLRSSAFEALMDLIKYSAQVRIKNQGIWYTFAELRFP